MYVCKSVPLSLQNNENKQDTFDFISKFINQLEIDEWLDMTMLLFALAIYICAKLERHIVCNFCCCKGYLLDFIKNIII